MSSQSPREVVITGVGIFSPIGIGREAFLDSLLNQRSGIKPVEVQQFLASDDCVAGEVSDFTDSSAKKEYLRSLRKSVKVMCREIQMGVASALQAMDDCGIKEGEVASDRIGIDFGANLMSSPPEVLGDAAAKSAQEAGDHFEFEYSKWGVSDDGELRFPGMEPLWLLRYLPNMPGCHIGIALDAQGPNNSITQDEASGGLAVCEAMNVLRRGRADVMLTGVTGTRMQPVKSVQCNSWDGLASGPGDPATRCRPFDRNRTGEVVAEAACTLVLETRESAEKRGATILGSMLGVGSACVLSGDGTPDEQKALEMAIGSALRNAGLTPDDIDHINACAAGHVSRDRKEAAALHAVFGSRISEIPVTAIKSYCGSAGSGSSLVELAASILAMNAGKIPPTLNYEQPDDEYPLNVVHGEALEMKSGTILKTSVTRMGQAVAMIARV